MRKTLLFVMILAITAISCSKHKSKSLEYNDDDPIQMVFRGEHKINVSSDYSLSFTAINELPAVEVLTVDANGLLYGKNVGNARVKISNGYNEKTVDVTVSLFEEPTFEFGCNTDRIKELYGRPFQSGYIDTILIYRYTSSEGYSYACGEMDFLFDDGIYIESAVYLHKKAQLLLSRYFEDNYILDTVVGDSVPTEIYRNLLDPTIVCVKSDSGNQYDEICLAYYRADVKSCASVLNRRPRSSKLLY